MKRAIFTFVILVASLGWAAKASALPFRTFVSISGNDANDCTLKTPCRTFGGTESKTEGGGEITAIDSGTYGRVTINKALTVQAAPGVYAVLASGLGASPVIVSAKGGKSPGLGDVVVLRNLYISQMSKSGKNAATKGIELKSAGKLYVESCVVTGFFDAGLFQRGSPDQVPILSVKDSVFRENGDLAGLGVGGPPKGAAINIGLVLASIDHCRIENNVTGVLMEVSNVTIRDSVVVHNFGGLDAEGASLVRLENCMVTTNSEWGIRSGIGPFGVPEIYVSTTMIAENTRGLDSVGGGKIISFGNNRLAHNFEDGAFTSTIAQK